MLSPPPSTCQSPSSNMYSTCRALQSLLASNLPTLSPSPKIIRAPPQLGSPIVLLTTAGPRAAAQPKKTKSHNTVRISNNAKITKSHPRTPPRSNLKRRRSSSSSSDDDNDEATARDPLTLAHPIPSTPKRQRTCPPTLPLGLDSKDFDALSSSHPVASGTPPHTPAPTNPPLHTPEHHQTETNKHKHENDQENENDQEKEIEQEEESAWSTNDDSALVSLILSKLRLRQSDWDDCARKLGKESHSIGRRWAHLLGDGEVGLRRGRGKRVRGEVGTMVFGPLLPLVREKEVVGVGKEE